MVKKSKKSKTKSAKVVKNPSNLKRRFGIALRNLILFLIMFVVSYGLYSASSSDLMINLFFLLSVIFGFVSLAFLLVLLIFVFMKIIRK